MFSSVQADKGKYHPVCQNLISRFAPYGLLNGSRAAGKRGIVDFQINADIALTQCLFRKFHSEKHRVAVFPVFLCEREKAEFRFPEPQGDPVALLTRHQECACTVVMICRRPRTGEIKRFTVQKQLHAVLFPRFPGAAAAGIGGIGNINLHGQLTVLFLKAYGSVRPDGNARLKRGYCGMKHTKSAAERHIPLLQNQFNLFGKNRSGREFDGTYASLAALQGDALRPLLQIGEMILDGLRAVRIVPEHEKQRSIRRPASVSCRNRHPQERTAFLQDREEIRAGNLPRKNVDRSGGQSDNLAAVNLISVTVENTEAGKIHTGVFPIHPVPDCRDRRTVPLIGVADVREGKFFLPDRFCSFKKPGQRIVGNKDAVGTVFQSSHLSGPGMGSQTKMPERIAVYCHGLPAVLPKIQEKA